MPSFYSSYTLPAVLVLATFGFQVDEEYGGAVMLCRKCGHGILNMTDIINIPTSKAIRQRNDTLSSNKMALIQLLENPQGNQFEVITAQKANGLNLGEKVEEHSWFPGFSWSFLVCPHCGFHLGWIICATDESVESGFSFFGLILSSLIGSTYADSLVFSPKAYQS